MEKSRNVQSKFTLNTEFVCSSTRFLGVERSGTEKNRVEPCLRLRSDFFVLMPIPGI